MKRVKHKPRKTPARDTAVLVKAIKEIKNYKKSVRSVGEKYGLPFKSLCRYVKKIDQKFPSFAVVDDVALKNELEQIVNRGPPTIFTKEQENALMTYLIKCNKIYYGLSMRETKELAYEFAVKLNVNVPQSWHDAQEGGKEWLYGFLKRHRNLAIRTPEQTTLNRVKAFSKENVKLFFDNYEALLEEHNYGPSEIWNMDETGFSTVPTKIGKVISEKGCRRVGIIAPQERGSMVTMAIAVNAAGNSIPPFFIYSTARMQTSFLDGTMVGTAAYANGSGWMKKDEFKKFITHFVRYSGSSKNKPTLLLLDNHQSHLSIEALDYAVEHFVTILSFPAHCSHKMQPLDVAVYGPLKKVYNAQCSSWIKSNAGRLFELRHVASVATASIDLAVTPHNVKAGFKATGIWPVNRHIFRDDEFIQTELNTETEVETEVIDEYDYRSIAVFDEPGDANDYSHSTANLDDTLTEIGPVQKRSPRPKSNRGRKPMQTSILTSPEQMIIIRERAEKASSKNKKRKEVEPSTSCKKQPSTSGKNQPSTSGKNQPSTSGKNQPSTSGTKPVKKAQFDSSDEDIDFCIICTKNMPKVLNHKNSIRCNECDRAIHLKCATLKYGSFTCITCEKDYISGKQDSSISEDSEA